MDKFESYRAPDEYLMDTITGLELPALPELTPNLKGKLKYYAGETPETHSPLSIQEAIEGVFTAEGRDPQEAAGLLEALREYEVVYPNMFLTEDISDSRTSTTFSPRGDASNRLEQMAARVVQAIKESNAPKYDPEVTGLDYDALTDHVYEYLQASLSGPFASILEIEAEKPILVLNDMSYTSQQLFRAFSGVYCDFTPTLKLSKADFLEFTVYHEIAHKKTEEIVAAGPSNRYVPGIDLGISEDAISHENLFESIADGYAVLKHIQRTGSTELPEQIAAMRTLDVFSNTFKEFVTPFTLKLGGGSRRRSEVEHFTAPTLDALIPRAEKLFQSGELQRMNDDELVSLAISVAREMKMSGEGLEELSNFATSLTFNALRENLPGVIPPHKDSISPSVVQKIMDAVEQKGSFTPRGGNSLELSLISLGEDQSRQISDELKGAFARYRDATAYVQQNGVPPFTDQSTDHFLRDLLATLNLPANQTPNTTVARELNDSWASMDKHTPFTGGNFNLVGARKLLELSDVDPLDDAFDRGREYIERTRDQARSGDLILKMFGE